MKLEINEFSEIITELTLSLQAFYTLSGISNDAELKKKTTLKTLKDDLASAQAMINLSQKLIEDVK